MQLASKIPDVHVQLWASALLKGMAGGVSALLKGMTTVGVSAAERYGRWGVIGA